MRLMTWQIPLTKKRYATLISAYAPNLDLDLESKEAFYAFLNAVICRTTPTDKLTLLRGFKRQSEMM